MLRYVLALILINAYSRSLGAPPPNPFSELAKRCENRYLSAQIENKSQECSQLTISKKRHFECLIFYDINSQLCSAASKLAISEDYIKKINEELDVKDLCEAAKAWTFTTLQDKYINEVKTVFQNSVKCAKVCGVEDVDSEDSIFYCKYYKWGWEMMKTLDITQVSSSNGAAPIPGSTSTIKSIKIPYVSAGDVNINSLNPSTSLRADVLKEMETAEINKNNTTAKPDVTQSHGNGDNKVLISSKSKDAATPPNIKIVELSGDNLKTPNNKATETLPNQVLEDVSSTVKKDNISRLDENNIMVDNSQIEHPNDNDDNYPNISEEDSRDGDGADPSAALDQSPPRSSPEKIVPPISEHEDSQKGYYPYQEDFEEDDDHFFPLFLTAIILAVLLYVLYHNKSKVTKVVLGLIVEGRQPGRRRNSRGHAYRRLDTLEQAMSGSMAAPPSKIIY